MTDFYGSTADSVATGVENLYGAPTDAHEDHAEHEVESDHDQADGGEQVAGGQKRRTAARGKLTPALVKRVLEQRRSLKGASSEHREVLAAVLGGTSDPEALTVRTLTAQRADYAALAELVDIASDDDLLSSPFALMVRVGQLEEHTKRLWALLVAVGAASGSLPSNEKKALPALAEAIHTLDPDVKNSLAAVAALVR